MGDFIIDFTGEASRAYYAPLLPLVIDLRRKGLSVTQIGQELEQRGIRTFKGGVRWSGNQVTRALLRSLRPVVLELQHNGLSIGEIAREMDRQGFRPLCRRRNWRPAQVQRLLDCQVDA